MRLVEHVQAATKRALSEVPKLIRAVKGSRKAKFRRGCQEKLLSRIEVPVPETDTGRRGENPKTSGRTLIKELGKKTP